LFLVVQVAWRSFAIFAATAADAAETGGALAERLGEAVDLAQAAAEESSGELPDAAAARARVAQLQAERAERREIRHEKHLARGRNWHLDSWLADRQSRASS